MDAEDRELAMEYEKVLCEVFRKDFKGLRVKDGSIIILVVGGIATTSMHMLAVGHLVPASRTLGDGFYRL